ncbi:hypothetical protein [Dactylosporangium sp. CA-233914]|uniref:hypothetical protein n=1 Tax=Dactylosporangium sp. CA-233914 TaxID=3239934 RepID=UPI003D8C164A
MSSNPLSALRDDDAPGTRLSAEGLVLAGRRRVRRRRNAIVGTAFALVLVLTAGVAAVAGTRPAARPAIPDPPVPTASPTAACTVDLLPVPDGRELLAPVVDPTGHWAAARLSDRNGAVIWHDGVIDAVYTDIDIIALHGISAKGAAVATATVDGRLRAITLRRDYKVVLTLPQGASAQSVTYGMGINAGGDVVGYYDPADGNRRPILWRFKEPLAPVLLATPGNQEGGALSIADDGRVGGFLGAIDNSPKPYLWGADGTGRQLPLADRQADGTVGAIAGSWAADLGNSVRWRLDEPAIATRVEVSQAAAVGLAGDGTMLYGGARSAVLWGVGSPRRLALPPGYSSYLTGTISADGRVAAGAARQPKNNGGGAPFLWHCTG